MLISPDSFSELIKAAGIFGGGVFGAWFWLRRNRLDALTLANQSVETLQRSHAEKDAVIAAKEVANAANLTEIGRLRGLVDLSPVLTAIREDRGEADKRSDAAVAKLEATITKAQQENVKGFRDITKVLNEISNRLKPAVVKRAIKRRA